MMPQDEAKKTTRFIPVAYCSMSEVVGESSLMGIGTEVSEDQSQVSEQEDPESQGDGTGQGGEDNAG